MDPKRWSHIDLDLGVEEAPDVRLCDIDGCKLEGEFKAPKSRQRLRDYHHFCLEHVQAYNRSWNFYDGMDDDQIEANRRADMTWQRQTWPMGANAPTKGEASAARHQDTERAYEEAFARQRKAAKQRQEQERKKKDNPFKGPRPEDLNDIHGLFEDGFFTSESYGPQNRTSNAFNGNDRSLSPDITQALSLFNLPLPLEAGKLRSRYKELAKRLHPDSSVPLKTGMDKEEMFKRLNAAYDLLKTNLPTLSL